jgi:hypothetical protein
MINKFWYGHGPYLDELIFKVVYDKTAYKNTIFVYENLW